MTPEPLFPGRAVTRAGAYRLALEILRREGLLLLADARLPSVATLVAGGPVRGSWWGHPRGHDIFDVSSRLANHEDVTSAKLISRKVTFVHRCLWPALAAVGGARDRWQLRRIPLGARRLYDLVMAEGDVHTDQIVWPTRGARIDPAKSALELEERLLVHSEEVHTESGAHAKRLTTWPLWATRHGVPPNGLTPDAGRARIEEAAARLGATARLPWG